MNTVYQVSDAKNLRVERRCKLSHKLVSINLVEFLTEIISYAVVTVRVLQNKKLCAQPYPILLNWTDNQTSQAWIKKAATRTPKGKNSSMYPFIHHDQQSTRD